jgi:cAMP-dependent protein kinase regulator
MGLENMDIEPKRKKYILETLNPIIEGAVGTLIASEPADPISFLIEQFVAKQGANGATADENEPEPVARKRALQQKLNLLKEDMRKQVVVNMQLEKKDNGEAKPADKDEEEEEEEEEEIEEPPPVTRSGMRQSVSAEAYGDWNKQKTDFKPPVYEKTKAQSDRLQEILPKSFIFESVDDVNLTVLIKAMHKVELKADQKIINEGDNGDFLFCVDEGELICFKEAKPTEVLKTCVGGDIFGELALLYNCPRAASVSAKVPCVLWKLDRETFNHISSTAAESKRKRLTTFLSKVPLLESFSDADLSSLSDVMILTKVESGKDIVSQGDDGDVFYIVEEGSAVAVKDGKEVMSYAPGDYFGELALLSSKAGKRAATVKASSDCRLVSIKRVEFKRLLGNLETVLQQRASSYV